MGDEEIPESSSPSPVANLILAGKRFRDAYNSQNDCLRSIRQPLMLPPAPQQKHVDLFSEQDKKVGRKADFDSKRTDYEAECDVYRALERSDHEMTVLHGFKYTSDQWKTFVSEENATESEHDFVVIIPSCSAVICIEVKRPKSEKNYESAYKEARRQTNQFEEFFNGAVSFCNGKQKYSVLKFCAFSHANEKDQEDNESLHKVSCEELPIIWKNDLDDICHSLGKRLPVFKDKQAGSDIEALLIGIWLRRNNFEDNTNDALELVIGNEIKDINRRLKKQEIYCKAQNRSGGLKPVPKAYKAIFKDHLNGVEYITKEQNEFIDLEKEDPLLFKEPYVFVNGSAGSGKTLMMRARILKLLECMGEDEQVLMLIPWWDAAEEFADIVKNFDDSITIKKIDLVAEIRRDEKTCDLYGVFSNTMKECVEKLVIFVRPNSLLRQSVPYKLVCKMHQCFLKTLHDRKWHIFFDDFHSSFAHSMLQHYRESNRSNFPSWSTNIEPLADFLFNLLSGSSYDEESQPRSLWIGCDLMQTVEYSFWRTPVLYNETLDHLVELFIEHAKLTLSGNLRNTCGITLLLQDLMKNFLEKSGENREQLQKILPPQRSYHFIEGFATKLYCVMGKESSSCDNTMTHIIRKELKMIHNSYLAAGIDHKIAIIPVYHHVSVLNESMSGARGDWSKKIQEGIEMVAQDEGLKDFDIKSNFTDYVKYANSMEFPCVVLIIDLSSPESKDLTTSSDAVEHSLMNILAHLYVGVSRARVYCSIILICSDNEPNELFKELRDILRPHVQTIELY